MVGLGQIGQGYDYDQVDRSLILTHSTAISAHNGFELIAGVDTCAEQRNRFEQKFSAPAYASLQDLKEHHAPDTIAVCVPLPLHFSVFNEAIALAPKAIVLEKPLAQSLDEAAQMIAAADNSGCAVSVNYLRRFNPAIRRLFDLIETSEVGIITKATVWYTKGIEGNGSHFIDLLLTLLGKVQNFTILKKGNVWEEGDPELDIHIRFGDTDVYMIAGNEESFYMGRIDFVGTNGMIRYEDGQPIKYWLTKENPLYPGENHLEEQPSIENPDDKNIWFAYENLHQHLEQGAPLHSTLQSAMDTLGIVKEILSQSEDN